MNDTERPRGEVNAPTKAASSVSDEVKDLRSGVWRLRPDVVVRIEEDGAILFDPDTDALSVINSTGSALLQWRRDRISYDEWCRALSAHYGVGQESVAADVETFLAAISHFAEPCDGKSN